MRSCRPMCRRTSPPRRSDRSTTPSIASSGCRFGLSADCGERRNWRTARPEPVALRQAQGERVEASPRARGMPTPLLTGISGILIVALAAQVGVSAAPSTDLSALERRVASEPENLRIAADYRQAAIGAGEFDRSIRFLERLAQQSGAANAYINLALAYVDKVPPSGDIRRLYLGRDAMNALTKAIE